MDPVPPLVSRKIGPKNQVNLPAEYVKPFGLQTGQQVYFAPNPDRPGTLVLVPEGEMAEVLRKGWIASG